MRGSIRLQYVTSFIYHSFALFPYHLTYSVFCILTEAIYRCVTCAPADAKKESGDEMSNLNADKIDDYADCTCQDLRQTLNNPDHVCPACTEAGRPGAPVVFTESIYTSHRFALKPTSTTPLTAALPAQQSSQQSSAPPDDLPPSYEDALAMAAGGGAVGGSPAWVPPPAGAAATGACGVAGRADGGPGAAERGGEDAPSAPPMEVPGQVFM
jgi:hypothetical protein